jgi:hypothetical protein
MISTIAELVGVACIVASAFLAFGLPAGLFVAGVSAIALAWLGSKA